jgi:hypothetical protein
MSIDFEIMFFGQGFLNFAEEFHLILDKVGIVDYSATVSTDQMMVMLFGTSYQFISTSSITKIKFKDHSHLD